MARLLSPTGSSQQRPTALRVPMRPPMERPAAVTRERGDSLMWVTLFVVLGVVIIVNLPPEPAPRSWWFLLGAASIAAAIAAAIYEWWKR